MAHYRIGDTLYDGDATTWENHELSAVKRNLGCGLSKFMEMLAELDPDAIQTFIWILRRRTEPGLQAGDVTFTVKQYIDDTELTDEDVRDVYENVPADDRKAFRDSLDAGQQERLFDERGALKGRPAPLALADTASGETSEASTG